MTAGRPEKPGGQVPAEAAAVAGQLAAEPALPPPDLDAGIITSGLCATPADQAEFDAHQAGQPPATNP